MSESRVIVTAQAEQAIREFRRLQQQGSGSLRELSNAGGLIDNTLRRTTTSAAQTTAALRQVPAQFTDIITSLQGGQAPLTVLLQQGGQLKDMFGGVMEAAGGLGGYVAGLVSPFTVATAAAVALAFAHHAGAAEAKEYQRTLILSGNAIGATSGQLSDVARNIGLVSGSQHVASEAVTALAGSTRVSIADLQKFGGVAVEVQKVVGRSIKDTVEDFSDLGKAPLTALTKINEKYHFVTAATFAQVKALTDQGRATEAATVAQNAYADAVTSQKTKILDSLTDWERGWIRIKNAASGAVDAAIDLALGRQATNTQKISAALAEREIIEKRIQVAVQKGDKAKEAQFRLDLEQNATTINGYRAQTDAAKAAAEADAKSIKSTELRNKWLSESDTLLSRVALRDRELAAARTEGVANGLSEAEIQTRLAVVRKKYNDIYVDGVDSQIAALNRRSAVEDMINKRAVDNISFQRSAGMINEQQAIEQTTQIELAAFVKRKQALQEELALIRQKQNSRKDQADKQGEIDALEEERNARKIKGTEDLFLAEQKLYRQSAENYADQIDKSMGDTATLRKQLLDQKDYNEQIGMTQVQLANLVATRMNDAAAVLEQNAAIADGIDLSGRQSEEYRKQAQLLRETASAKVIGATSSQQFDEWKKSVDQYSDVFRTGFADMLNNGKTGWKSFTTSLATTFKTTVADQIYKMFAQPFVVRMVGSLLGVQSDALGTMIQGVSGSSAGATGTPSGLIGMAQTASSLYKTMSGGFAGISTSVANGVQSAMSAVGYYPSAASGLASGTGQALTPFASGAGAAAGIAAGVVGGVYGGRMISGAYGSNGAVNTGTAVGAVVGSIVPVIGTALGALVGGLLGGAYNRLFGYKSAEVESQGVRGTYSGDQLSGQSYQNILQKGGLFRSDKHSTEITAFTSDMQKQFVEGFSTLKSVAAGFASSLDVSADSLASYSKAFDIKLTSDAAANDAAITAFFTGVSEEIALRLVPNLATFSKSGETMSATLERLSGDFQGTNQVAMLTGTNGKLMFGSLGIESAAARERLIDLAGGIANLGTQANMFAQNYLTEAERLAPVSEAVAAAMASIGLAGVTTRDEFKHVVQGLDVTTAAGAQQYASMMALADSFAQVHPLIEATNEAMRTEADILSERNSLQQQLDQLELTEAQQRAKQRLEIAADNLDLFDQITRRQEVNAATDAFKTLFDSLKSNSDSIHGYIDQLNTGTLSTLTPMQRYLELQRQYSESVARAKASPADSAAQAAAQTAGTNLLTLSQQLFASSSTFVGDRAKVLGDMTTLASIVGSQMSDAQKQLALAGDQVTGIATLNTTAVGIQQAIVALGSGTALVAPSFNATAYSGSADGRDVLVQEIKRLNGLVIDLTAEVRGRRTDAQRQSDFEADTTKKGSDAIAAGLAATAKDNDWRARTETRRAPR